MSTEPYYYVFRPGHSAPTKKHDLFEQAKAEAERLCACNRGARFEICRVVAITQAAEIKTEMISTPWEAEDATPKKRRPSIAPVKPTWKDILPPC